jgi:putative GTP pyrophosphokinase
LAETKKKIIMNLDILWRNNTELIRSFIDQRNDYEQLCSEISYILKKRHNSEIEFSTISSRVKTLNSFLEKIERKSYKDPLTEISDFAGVRVVYLYQKDLERIETEINSEFNVIERIDKLNEKGTDKFGYGAIHFIVQIGKKSTGARYEDLKKLKCEIQVRTVMQDAWAIIDHHLVYKYESEIPTNLQRKMNSLAGLFETADNQFDSIRIERENYLKKIEDSIGTVNFLNNEVNLDTFQSYLKWKFPILKSAFFEEQTMIIFNGISTLNFKTLKELDNIIDKYKNNFEEIKKVIEEEFKHSYFEEHEMSSSLLVSTILQIDNLQYLERGNIPDDLKEFLKHTYHKKN